MGIRRTEMVKNIIYGVIFSIIILSYIDRMIFQNKNGDVLSIDIIFWIRNFLLFLCIGILFLVRITEENKEKKFYKIVPLYELNTVSLFIISDYYLTSKDDCGILGLYLYSMVVTKGLDIDNKFIKLISTILFPIFWGWFVILIINVSSLLFLLSIIFILGFLISGGNGMTFIKNRKLK